MQKILYILSGPVPPNPRAELDRFYHLARISQTTPSRAGQESVKYESAQTLSGDGVLKHSEVDKVEQIRSLPAIDTRNRNEFEICGLKSTLIGNQIQNFQDYFESPLSLANSSLGNREAESIT